MAKQEILNLLTAALTRDESITFGDGASAESFRMHIYRLKRKWKKEGSPYHALFEDIIIKRDKLHDNILDFTSRSRAFDDVLSRFKDSPIGTIEEPMSVEEKEYLDDVISGKDHGKEVLAELGYGVTVTDNTTPSYDTCYAKECAGGKLTKQEEQILQAGPDAERTE